MGGIGEAAGSIDKEGFRLSDLPDPGSSSFRGEGMGLVVCPDCFRLMEGDDTDRSVLLGLAALAAPGVERTLDRSGKSLRGKAPIAGKASCSDRPVTAIEALEFLAGESSPSNPFPLVSRGIASSIGSGRNGRELGEFVNSCSFAGDSFKSFDKSPLSLLGDSWSSVFPPLLIPLGAFASSMVDLSGCSSGIPPPAPPRPSNFRPICVSSPALPTLVKGCSVLSSPCSVIGDRAGVASCPFAVDGIEGSLPSASFVVFIMHRPGF